jgi:phage terminase large subunit
MLDASRIKTEMPEWAEMLFKPARYKVMYGGRGGGKSWSVAKALLILGASNRERILCAREVQKSLRDSVKKLLDDQIGFMGLGGFYESQETIIRGKNGTEIIFTGLSDQTSASLKSYEGTTIAWVEEAQTVSQKSWEILIPTIRKDDSEIWVSFNPQLDTDETYKRFVLNPPPDSIVREVNYNDNPYFNKVLDQERIHCQATDPDSYDTIWLGKCRSAVIGAVYAREVDQLIRNHRVTFLPYDPNLKVFTVWDMGWNDAMAIAFVQVMRSECRIIDYIEDDHKTLDWYAAELRNRPYNYAHDYLPHDAAHGDYKTGVSAERMLQKLGRKTKITPNIDVTTGIHMTRMLFPRIVLDKEKTVRLVECAKRYRRSINKTTQTEGPPVHDEYSHGADVLRYIAININSMTNEDEDSIIHTRPRIPAVAGMGY